MENHGRTECGALPDIHSILRDFDTRYAKYIFSNSDVSLNPFYCMEKTGNSGKLLCILFTNILQSGEINLKNIIFEQKIPVISCRNRAKNRENGYLI